MFDFINLLFMLVANLYLTFLSFNMKQHVSKVVARIAKIILLFAFLVFLCLILALFIKFIRMSLIIFY